MKIIKLVWISYVLLASIWLVLFILLLSSPLIVLSVLREMSVVVNEWNMTLPTSFFSSSFPRGSFSLHPCLFDTLHCLPSETVDFMYHFFCIYPISGHQFSIKISFQKSLSESNYDHGIIPY